MKIRSFEFCAAIFILMQCCLLGFFINGSYRYMGQNCWIVPLIGMIVGFPILLIYLYLFNQNKSINSLINDLFKKSGKIINMILILFFSLFSMILFWNITNFTSSQYLYNTPQLYIEIIFIISFIYVLSHGTNSLFRTLLVLVYVLIIIYIINFTSLITQVDINNIKPIFYGKFNLFKSLIDYIGFIICPIFILLIIPKNKIDDVNINKKIIITYFVSNISNFIILFLLISVFGINLLNLYQYPEYHILKRVTLFGLGERFEKILAIYWFLVTASGIILTIHYIYKNLNFSKKIIYILIIISLLCSEFLFSSSTSARYYIGGFFSYIMIVFLVIVPLFIFLKIKKSSKTT